MAPEASNALHMQPQQTGRLRKTRTQNLPFHVQATLKPGREKARSEGDLNTSKPFQLTVTEHAGPETLQPCSLPRPGLPVTQIHAFPVPALPSTLVTVSTAHPFLQPQVSVNLCQRARGKQAKPEQASPSAYCHSPSRKPGEQEAESLLQGEQLSAPRPPQRTCRLSARSTKRQAGEAQRGSAYQPRLQLCCPSRDHPTAPGQGWQTDTQLHPQLQTWLLKNPNRTNSSGS